MVFQNLVDLAQLEGLCSSFTSLTGAGTAIVDLDGAVLVATGWQELCTRFHRQHPVTAARCRESDTILSRCRGAAGGCHRYECANGLVDVSVPILVGDEQVATLFTGQFFLAPPDLARFRAQAREFGFDQADYLQAVAKVPVYDAGRVTGVTEFLQRMARFLGDLAQARRQLLAAARMRVALFEASPDGMLVIDPRTARFLDFNTAAHTQLGYSREEFARLGIFDVEAHETDAETRATIAGVLQRGAADFETVQRTKQGELRQVHVTAKTVDVHGQQVYYCVWRDVTARRQDEAALRRFKAIIDAANTGAAIADLDGRLLYVNDCFAAAHGYKVAELLGRPLQCLHDAAQLPEVERLLAHARGSGGFTAQEVGHSRRDGSTFVMLMACKLVRGSDGQADCYVATTVDLTERKALESQLLQAQKMESVGRLAGGVAHDFNNMLSVILGNVELALLEVSPTWSLHEKLLEVKSAAERSALLTRQLLAFARRQLVAPRIVDLDRTVQGMLQMLRRLIGENIQLGYVAADGLWPVRIDPAQIDQLLANLCVNARDAIAGVGSIRIVVRNVVVEPGDVRRSPDAVPGDYVQVAVADDGCGMSAATQARLFEPFFTTKPVGQGTGLGLATVYGIVRQNGGFVTVRSAEGKGSTFLLHLPRHRVVEAEAAAPAAAAEARRGTETVLLVEDEPTILQLGVKLLSGLGYRVLAAGSPREALRLAAEHGPAIQVLMTDVVMPQMNGRDLAAQVRALAPAVKCLFMSGYTADVVGASGAGGEAPGFLQKPFTLGEVATRLREVLARA